ncbi:glycosyltransferase [Modestobacter sp. I12A-02628]|uniref:Glycosyltransferase family 2 protein n=1 Tax=Goekera deserti TaxID=2497753 RepID=A0A7K3WGI9_9ACTN|nr:glycosyltransferase family 2 protein [Goekera deserti]MPQ97966.1 glycosyltransferase [Goekera deserti]NDI48612.1 glycosyltransferase [Goekera deserti]NEL55009.1 glycosyltransferase family 2 protein [Goekera deserti]
MPSAVPLVSIGLPVYNGERYLQQTLATLLDQTAGDFELVVCDNASTDSTPAICARAAAADPRVRYVRNPVNIGLGRNFNRVFALSRGRYFRWAMGDDLVTATNLADCLEVLESRPEVVLAVPGWDLVDATGAVHPDTATLAVPHSWSADLERRLEQYVDLLGTPHAIAVMPYLSGLVRSEALWRTGLLGSYPSSDDVLLAELAVQGQLAETGRHSLSIRLHAGSAGHGIGTGDHRAVHRTFFPDAAARSLALWRRRRFPAMLAVLGRADLPADRRRALQARYLRACWRGLR